MAPSTSLTLIPCGWCLELVRNSRDPARERAGGLVRLHHDVHLRAHGDVRAVAPVRVPRAEVREPILGRREGAGRGRAREAPPERAAQPRGEPRVARGGERPDAPEQRARHRGRAKAYGRRDRPEDVDARKSDVDDGCVIDESPMKSSHSRAAPGGCRAIRPPGRRAIIS